jgi:serine/threonine-protein phosphatase 2A regulatory subunit B
MPLLKLPGALLQRTAGADQRAPPPLPKGAQFEYRYLTEFQSHEPEFDYLKSLEIEEKVNKVRWCKSSNNSHMLLSTNDKTIKLWKVGSA